jgi:hypothetical protein
MRWPDAGRQLAIAHGEIIGRERTGTVEAVWWTNPDFADRRSRDETIPGLVFRSISTYFAPLIINPQRVGLARPMRSLVRWVCQIQKWCRRAYSRGPIAARRAVR